jgi:hypothetical protein
MGGTKSNMANINGTTSRVQSAVNHYRSAVTIRIAVEVTNMGVLVHCRGEFAINLRGDVVADYCVYIS